MKISEFALGKVDGKEEFLLDGSNPNLFFDAFLLPENISIDAFESRESYFISGFRGTGKTSLLRYIIWTSQPNRKLRSIVLFKSDIAEEQRLQMSQQVGMSIAEHDSGKMGIAQDYKSAWMWFVLHKIAELMQTNPAAFAQNDISDKFLRMMGLGETSPFRKVLGFLPRLEGAKVRITADTGLFRGDLDLNFEKSDSTTATVSFSELVNFVCRIAMQIELKEKLVIGIDELEVFFFQEEQHSRDLAMVRDLVFAVDRMNRDLRANEQPILVIAAIRREVVDAIGVLGQEVNRVVHDRGVTLAWHHSQRSLKHPLIEMVRRKMRASLPKEYSGDPIEEFFDQRIDEEPLDAFLLDRSFYRPRDLMWRLTYAQRAYPMDSKFGNRVLRETESDYSSQLWSEVEYELSATYSSSEIQAIASIFSGIKRVFFLGELETISSNKAKYSLVMQQFLVKHSLADLCNTLYSHGALGNDFRTGPTGNVARNRWIFRRDKSLVVDQRMTLKPALRKALSAIDVRRRGARSSGQGRGRKS